MRINKGFLIKPEDSASNKVKIQLSFFCAELVKLGSVLMNRS